MEQIKESTISDLTVEDFNSDTEVHQHIEDRNTLILPDNKDDLDLESTTKAVVPVKIPRENGFGDFCFGRPLFSDRLVKYNGKKKFDYDNPASVIWSDSLAILGELGKWSQAEWVASSGNLPDEYQREGSFKYLKLPLEIKQRILRHLLAPFFKLDPNTNTELVCITLKPFIPPNVDEEAFEDSIETYCQVMDQHYMQNRHLGAFGIWGRFFDDFFLEATDDVVAESKSWFEKVKKAYHFELKEHPARGHGIEQYVIDANIAKNVTRPGGQNKDWAVVQLLQNLSNVSTNFREEISTILWKDIQLDVRLDEDKLILPIMDPFDRLAENNLWNPSAFLAQRPLVHKGIKSLHLFVDHWNEDIDMFKRFEKFCTYIIKECPELELSHLHIHIDSVLAFIKEIPLRVESGFMEHYNIYPKEYNTKRLEITRLMKVSNSFELTWTYPPGCPEDLGETAQMWEREGAEFLPRAREFLMPNTLRNKKEVVVNEETKYLQSRLL